MAISIPKIKDAIKFGVDLFGGVAPGIGQIITNGYNSHKAHDLAILQYNLQRKLAQFTGSNAHQWEVSDLRKAGLNPVLSANSGQTYSTGSIGGQYGNAQNPAKEGIDSYLSIRSTMANLENMSANTQKQKKETDLISEQVSTQSATTKLVKAQEQMVHLDNQLKKTDLKYAERQKLLQLRKEASFIAEINSNILKIGSERELIKNQMSLNNAERALKKSQEWRNYNQPLGFSTHEDTTDANFGIYRRHQRVFHQY